MKILVLIFILAAPPMLRGSEIPDAVSGTWVVTGFRFAGTSALSKNDAKAWIGRTLVIGGVSRSLIGDRINSPRVRYTRYDAEAYFSEGFHIDSSDIGYKASKVREYEIGQADGSEWIAPGNFLLIISNTNALTCWDGVFFVLTRKCPNKPPALSARI